MHSDSLQTAVIFAGGKSSRMGQDKALLPFADVSSMAEFQYRKLQPLFQAVYLSAKTDKFDFAAPVLLDHYPDSSPMVALASLFETLDTEAVLVLSVDMPMVQAADIERMRKHYRQLSQPDILIAQSPRGLEPLFGIYRRSILPHVHTLLRSDTHRIRTLLDRVETEVLSFENSDNFANLNTPEEYHAIHP
jgi:molybdopterin-guanine dinucleotide biosynthesis protein A